MLKLRSYLKPYVLNIVIIVVLLFFQANNDLSLPDYMSKIVNTGIANNGIEAEAPEILSKETYQTILMILDDSEKDIFTANYSEIGDSTEYDAKYPNAKSLGAFVLNNKEVSELNDLLSRKLALMAKKMMPQLPISEDEIESGEMSVSTKEVVNSVTVNFLKTEYQKLGADLEKIQSSYILKTGGIMLIVALSSLLCVVIVAYVTAKTVSSMAKNVRNDMFKKVVSFSSAEFNNFSTSSLITRCTNDISQIQNMLNMMLRMVIYAPIIGIGGIIRVLGYNLNMSMIVLVSVGMILCLVIVMFRFAMPKFKIVQTIVDKLNKVTRESLAGMLVIRAFNTQKFEEEKFDKTNRDLTDLNLFLSRLMSCMQPLMMLIMNFTSIAIVYFGAKYIDQNLLEVGDIMAFIQYAMQIMFSFLMISMISIMLPRASVSAQRISEVLSSDVLIKEPENPMDFNPSKKGIVEFKNVNFKYPDADEYVLQNINFVAKPGETTAFIGSNGSGKSTVINLIPRFYEIFEGEILVEGVEVKKASLHKLREKIGFIPQKAMLFSGTIESNIKFSDQPISEEEMIKAAKIAQAYDFIMEKENKFEENVAQSGSNVSGGQRQRLSIARAIAKKSNILIFDDSFSALDYKTDRKLREEIKNELKDNTVLIVAQRISTIRNAEQIIVMDEGKIVGIGRHKDLLKNCEVYRQIASSQLSKEELDNE